MLPRSNSQVFDAGAWLDSDGVLQGWCWCDLRPTERLVMEIIVDADLISTIVASRFREDLLRRNVGDGYHGFMVTLTNVLANFANGCLLAVRERSSGQIVWRQIIGGFDLPASVSDRISSLALLSNSLSQSRLFRRNHADGPWTRFTTELGQLGRELKRRSRPGS